LDVIISQAVQGGRSLSLHTTLMETDAWQIPYKWKYSSVTQAKSLVITLTWIHC